MKKTKEKRWTDYLQTIDKELTDLAKKFLPQEEKTKMFLTELKQMVKSIYIK